MTTALYRRYRPESFGEMIGQSQVTEPLMTALRTDRVGHAYLFSGPRGCGKTTSARILARCLNCAQGPTDTPCGVCDSCVELGRGGGGSLDVVEIDAASHNGVDDARDLRERATFAPSRDRFKIFILDEAHMVTPQGFNALLKLVEEPPDHVKFIFATTEPEKVIGTIRSRTHHYPFRLVAPAAMLEYVGTLCEQEGVTVEPGVLPLVVRAGGGSPRDTLSLLDQLIAGSEGTVVTYERAVSLLGYTHAELLDAVVDAFGAGDAAAAFSAVDRVVQTGQDPRRFVDDLLERLRDLIVIAATGQGAAAVLRGVPADELERMSRQAAVFGAERLSRIADLVVGTLDEMTGATSPRLQLELMIARVLAHGGVGGQSVPPAAATAAAATAAAPAAAASAAPTAAPAPAPAAASAPVTAEVAEAVDAAAPATAAATAPEATPVAAPADEGDEVPAASAPALAPVAPGPVTLQHMRDAWPEVLQQLEGISRASWLIASVANVAGLDDDILTLTFRSQSDVQKFKQRNAGAGPSEDLRSAIQSVLGLRVKYIARQDAEAPAPRADAAPDADPHPDADPDPDAPEGTAPADPSPPEPRIATPAPASAPPTAAPPAPRATRPAAPSAERRVASAAAPAPVTEWAVAPIPTDAGGETSTSLGSASAAATPAQFAVDDDPEDAASARARVATLAPVREGEVLPADEVETSLEPDDDEQEAEALSVDVPVPPVIAPPTTSLREDGVQRVGEAVIRQVLGARFVREEPYEPPTRFS
ncbi:MAG: DNA polymerase III subunit gamma and tau [Microbacterium sp.]|nr:DNA polymerase III subunit gamma and tau [Microbacterium sp.]